MSNSILIILGMHRSGTSALTRVCNLLGVPLGDALMAENDFNTKGFWEHQEVVELHESMLDTLHSTWDDVRDLPKDWEKNPAIASHKEKLTRLIKSHVEKTGLWGIKDPRMCRFLPLWKNILAELDYDAKVIHMVRNPYETAASLLARDGFEQGKGLLLWVKYNLEAERYSRDIPRVFVSYSALLDGWKKEVRRIEKALDMTFPIPAKEATKEINAYLDKGLKNHTEDKTKKTKFFGTAVANLYLVLQQAAQGEDLDSKVCDKVADNLTSWESGYVAAITESVEKDASVYDTLAQFKEENVRLKQVITEHEKAHNLQANAIHQAKAIIVDLQVKHKDLERRYDDLLASTSWKVTAPLRWLMETARGTNKADNDDKKTTTSSKATNL